MSAPVFNPASAFAPIVAASDVEQLLIDLLRTWLRDYLAELDRVQGQPVGTLQMPRSVTISSETERMPEDQTPALIVVSPGMSEPPLADGAGVYTARWRAELSMQVSARGGTQALRLARLYAAAMRALVLQQQAGSELSLRRIDWLGERYDQLPSIDDRTTCIGTVELAVEIADATTRHAGPLAPILPPDPDPDDTSPSWPTAELVDVQVHKETIT